MFDQILFHTLEKGELCSLLLGCRKANPVANIDEKVGNPGKQVLVTRPMERRHHLFVPVEMVFGGACVLGRSQGLNGGSLFGQRCRIGIIAY